MSRLSSRANRLGAVLLIVLAASSLVLAQSTATLQGTVTDETGAVIPGAKITVTNEATSVARTTLTDSSGNYLVAALPVGSYRVEVESNGLQHQVVQGLVLEVSRTVAQNFSLKPAAVAESVTITGEAPVMETTTMTVGQVIDKRTVQEIPLNGRHFVDLGLLIPGSVTPPANGFLTAPLRGQGSFAIVTAGNREDTVNFMINGVNVNDMANGQVTFQPSINTVQEFKVDNSTYSAEEGRNSGAIVNIATRSGSNDWHGEVFDFIRNNDLDARNFFNKDTALMSPFKRNNFGANLGGPILKNRTFFFASYEGLRQRQGLTLNQTVLTDAQRQQAQTVNNPTIVKLLPLIPQANDATGAKFLGSAVAPVNIDQWTGDVTTTLGVNDHLHGYYVFQRDQRKEPTLQGNNVPGAGDTRQSHRQIFTLGETHVFSSNLVNDVRFGYNRIHITFVPDSNLDPSTFGIADGQSGAIGLPDIIVGGINLRFGGIRNFPQGRGDYTAVLSDTASYLHGRHNFKFGGEMRRFNGNAFTSDDGQITFATATDFINGNPNGFAVTTGGNRPARVYMNALGLFAQDSVKVKPFLTLELGLRWDWNMSPTEAVNRSIPFVPASDSLVRMGTNGLSDSINQNDHNFEPRLGFSWDMFHDGKTVLRGGYGWQVDQFLPGPFILNSNPPLANPVAFTPTGAKPFTAFGSLLTDAAGSGLAPGTVDQNYKNAYVQSWNLNLQRQVTPSTAIMVGYFGSKGTHLNLAENINQITNGVRPFPTLSASSPILPGAALGNIISNTSVGNSNYNALWITGNRRLSKNLQFNASYTWSKSLDYNSRNFQNVTVQDSFNPRGDYGLSDFDVRNRFVINALYSLPFQGNRVVSGWQLSTIVQLQGGNPLNVVAGNPSSGAGISSFTGTAGQAGAPSTVRPDLVGTQQIVNQIITSGSNAGFIQWFPTNAVCDPRSAACPAGSIYALPVSLVGGANVYHFGNLRRDSVSGPGFENVDLSLSKSTKITERLRSEFRVEAFDLFNHPNFGNPGLVAQVGSSSFGVITGTRFPTGDSGSSRQLQFALKLIF